MNVVRQVVDGSVLAQIIRLPKHLQSKQVEIIVMPIEQNQNRQIISRSQLEARLSGSNTEVLTGALPIEFDTEVDKIRAERRIKYENFD